MYCPECDTKLTDDDWLMCPTCGTDRPLEYDYFEYEDYEPLFEEPLTAYESTLNRGNY